jgi:hypothetical protein
LLEFSAEANPTVRKLLCARHQAPCSTRSLTHDYFQGTTTPSNRGPVTTKESAISFYVGGVAVGKYAVDEFANPVQESGSGSRLSR